MDSGEFSERQLERYARHILLPEVGATGQAKLLRSRVLVVGAGGLGAPLLLYLAAAGVGTLGLIDDDTVDLSNLQRQVIHTMESIGRPKVESAAATVAALNPEVRLEVHRTRLDAGNAAGLIARYDIVADGTDNFPTRFLLNDACWLTGRTLVSAALLRFDGQLFTVKPSAGPPCYRCLFREPPPPGQIPSCSEAGIFGAVAGAVGCLQAVEVLKEIVGIGEGLAGRLLLYDGLAASTRTIKVRPDPACPLCGEQPTIRDLSLHRLSADGRAGASAA